MLCEYFYPFDRGGSEWSTYYLAQSLLKKGHTVSVFTPNYGSRPSEIWRRIKIHRFWFPIRLKKGSGQAISPLWHSNLLWFFITSIGLFRMLQKNNIDVLHIQGKYFLPSAYLIGKVKNLLVVFTARDFQLFCPYGLCLSKKYNYKAATLSEFLGWEIVEYQNIYHSRENPFVRIVLFLSGLRGFFIGKILIFFAKRVDSVIAISKKTKHILAINGIPSQVIYNPMAFSRSKAKKTNTILFIGRLTWGKGADLIIPAIAPILKKQGNLTFSFVGDGMLKETLFTQVKTVGLTSKVKFLGHRSYKQTLTLLKKALLLIVPSRWEEPFGRVALEALACCTPVVVSNRGGLPEIVEENKTGYVIEPEIRQIGGAIQKCISKNRFLQKKIHTFYGVLRKKFEITPANEYISLYHHLMKNIR